MVYPRKPFGLQSNFSEFTDSATEFSCFTRGYVLRNINIDKFADTFEIANKYKTLMAEAQSAQYQKKLNSTIAKPKQICLETYIVVGAFDTEQEAHNLKLYAETHLFQFLLKQCAITHHINKSKFTFVPDQMDYTKEYTDEHLYKKYGLTQEEIDFIESKFK